jgi:LysR family hydrogen peroxide-inducible transcriptional activator
MKIPGLSIIEAVYLVALDRFRHFGKAAKACHVTQAALSSQIKKIEERYGITLFDRTRKPLEPTKIGKILIQQAKHVYNEALRFEELIQLHHKVKGQELTVGIIPTLGPYLSLSIVTGMKAKLPSLYLFIREALTANLIEALEKNELDAIVIVTPVNVSDSFHSEVLWYEPFFVYAHRDHPLLTYQEVPHEALRRDDLWLLHEGHCFRAQILQLCGNDYLETRKVQFEGASFESLEQLIDYYGGFTLLPYLATLHLNEEQRARLRPLSPPIPTREISLLYPNYCYKRELYLTLRNVLQCFFDSQQSPLTSEFIRVEWS